jgi:hypothetical protein
MVMRKYLTAIGALAMMVAVALLAADQRSRAGVVCTLPVTLQNGTVADATQVMANLNQLAGCFGNNVAASGANNDITGLFALTTPIAPVNGGTPIYISSNSAGSANAQTIATTTPANFVLANGRAVMFVAGLTNTGAMTLNVAASGAVNVFRRTSTGPAAMVGGEVVAGNAYIVVYDGTQWELLTRSLPKVPSIQRFTTGTSQTYNTPVGVTWLEVRMVGGGGGGAGATGDGGVGTATLFSTGTAGGGAGAVNATGVAGVGGTATGCTDGTNGTSGGTGGGTSGGGGTGPYGGGPAGPIAGNGNPGSTNSGAGGSGAGGTSGGGSGAYCYMIIVAPAATFVYSVGTGGAGGATSPIGGAGAAGYILVVEHYGS